MKIYTKKGDAGQTQLWGGEKRSKDDPRIEVYGTVDELNSVLGMVQAQFPSGELQQILERVQRELFILGSELASTGQVSESFLQENVVHHLESEMDAWDRDLPPLTRFILPGGHVAAAQLHLARTVCRRAERALVSLQKQESIRPVALQYLNRLSDWCFVLARWVNWRLGHSDVFWEGLA